MQVNRQSERERERRRSTLCINCILIEIQFHGNIYNLTTFPLLHTYIYTPSPLTYIGTIYYSSSKGYYTKLPHVGTQQHHHHHFQSMFSHYIKYCADDMPATTISIHCTKQTKLETL